MNAITSEGAPQYGALYRTIWRWHFYAGLFVIPFILILSVTGGIYLFKPQLDRWQESEWTELAANNAVSPDAQVNAALAASPGASFHNYRLPQDSGDAALIHVGLANDAGMRDIYVSPQGDVLAIINPDDRISAFIANIHGSLLLGKAGSLLVELAASWTIVMILTGLYLWWPRGTGLAGVIWPRWSLRGRGFLRDLHAVTGFWVAGLALVTLASGLPWTEAWGAAFRTVRAEMGWNDGPQNWKGGGDLHAAHDHDKMMAAKPYSALTAAPSSAITLSDIVKKAQAENMPHPAIIMPPGAPARFGPPNGNAWKLTSEAQNRPLIRAVSYDPASGAIVSREEFADKHIIDKVINYGIAWHEGQLFGWINQFVGVLIALMLIALCATSITIWWKRKPAKGLGAPSVPKPPAKQRTAVFLLGALALFLPMLLASIILILVVETIGKFIGKKIAVS
ncbi:MAG: PepSY domain-containing protein [Parasphingorhabdus sp.]|uniref:PepSY-associated TM helix domain-containing protein n=1 Tax=Parasphingorhabdus sp. TaxID=2709688 RepID=UPI0030024BFE